MQLPIRILLVDDNPQFQSVLLDYLQLYETIEIVGVAEEGEHAFAKALELQPDVILLDLHLGGDLGLVWIPTLNKHLPETKVIILTVMGDEMYRSASLEAGADAFVPKTEISRKLISVILGLMTNARPDVHRR